MGQIDENTPKLKLKISSPEFQQSEIQAPIEVKENTVEKNSALPEAHWIVWVSSINTPITKEEVAESPKIKISISSIKSSHTQENSNIQENKQESKDTSKNASVENSSHLPETESSSSLIPTENIVSQNSDTPESKEEKQGVFKNYTSDFDKKSMSFMERIRSIGKTPKTRVGLVLSLILISCTWIGALMIIAPEKHSFTIYKTNILYLYQSKISKNPSIVSPMPVIQNETIPDPIIAGKEWQSDGSWTSISREQIKQEKLREFLRSKQ